MQKLVSSVEYHWFPHATLTMELCNLTGPTGEETLVHDEVTHHLSYIEQIRTQQGVPDF